MKVLTARQRSTVLQTVERHLTIEPLVQTRNRKPLEANDLAPWELRVGNLRAFYEVPDDSPLTVTILAIGIKMREKLMIAGEEYKL